MTETTCKFERRHRENAARCQVILDGSRIEDCGLLFSQISEACRDITYPNGLPITASTLREYVSEGRITGYETRGHRLYRTTA